MESTSLRCIQKPVQLCYESAIRAFFIIIHEVQGTDTRRTIHSIYRRIYCGRIGVMQFDLYMYIVYLCIMLSEYEPRLYLA